MSVKKFVTRPIFVAKPQDVARYKKKERKIKSLIFKIIIFNALTNTISNWRRFAVPVLLLAVMALLLWSSYVCLGTRNYKKTKSNFSIENQQSNTNKSSSKFQQTLGGIIGRRIANYCQIQTCDAASCSNIPYDSGTVVSNFIENKFKVQQSRTIFLLRIFKSRTFLLENLGHFFLSLIFIYRR